MDNIKETCKGIIEWKMLDTVLTLFENYPDNKEEISENLIDGLKYLLDNADKFNNK